MRTLAALSVGIVITAALIADVGFADTAIARGASGLAFLIPGVLVSLFIVRRPGIPRRWRIGAYVAIGGILALSLGRWAFFLAA